MSGPRLQNSLGKLSTTETQKDRNWSMEQIVLGRVTKVHHKRNTVDVDILNSSDTITSDSKNEGRYACRIVVPNSGVDSYYGKPYGSIIPIEKGSLVVVAFMKDSSKSPVILGTVYETSENIGQVNYNNILPGRYPIEDDLNKYRRTSITRTQDFSTIDGAGNFEIASHTKSFVVGTGGALDEEEFDYEDLSIKDKINGKTVNLPERASFPFKYLACFRSDYNDKDTNFLKVFIDAFKTSFKLFKQEIANHSLSLFEINEQGNIRVRRQLTSSKLTEDSSDFSEARIDQDGIITVQRTHNGKTTYVAINDSGVSIETELDIKFKGKNIELDSNVSITGNLNIQGQCNQKCQCS